jgi:chromosome segregation ATPase
MIITIERLAPVEASIAKLIEQGQKLFTDIEETTKDLASLVLNVEQHEQTIEQLKAEMQNLQARNRDLELRNSRLVDDLMKFETQYNEASARLDSIRATVNPKSGTGSNVAPLHRVLSGPAGANG